ncbi:MAG TPA: universal stress protein [Gemmatimonadales bacterium]
MDQHDLELPTPIHTILVPLDGSSLGEVALPVARSLARRLGAALDLTMVLEPVGQRLPRVPAAPPLDPPAEVELGGDRLALADEYLARIAAGVSDGVDVRTAITILEGAPAEMLARHLAEGAAQIVVMATHRRGELGRFLLGSVADELVRRATAPVLLIASGDERKAAHEADVGTRVLLPLDGSSSGTSIIRHAVSVAGSEGTRYLLARVLDPVKASIGPHMGVHVARADLPREGEEAEAFLEPLARGLRERGLTVETRVVVAPEPVGAILELARDYGANLIAMATHGYQRAERLVLGSVASRVLIGTDVPVLLYRTTQRATP